MKVIALSQMGIILLVFAQKDYSPSSACEVYGWVLALGGCVQSNAGAPYPGNILKSTRSKTTQVISATPTDTIPKKRKL